MENDKNRPLEQEFEFEVVTLNERGEVIRRHPHQAQQFREELPNGVGLDMVAIPEGSFLMGSRLNFGYPDEHPQHWISLPRFFMGKCPVTQAQWEVIMDWKPPYRCTGAPRPVDRVSWYEAWEFCERLAEKTGRAYRLPSEAEWEYACRARTTTPFYCGQTITTDLANYVGEHIFLAEPKGIYRHETTEVGSFSPNAFGLYDLHGNVWEWCADAWHDDYEGAPTDGGAWESRTVSAHVLRGGCWHDPPHLCRSAARLKHVPGEGEDYFGFRVALTSLEQNSDSARYSWGRANRKVYPTRFLARQLRRWFHRSR
ncbi:MAG: formylglycine-generating enzyme family protein [Anaerolineae bacterium]|nr:formylglycine-generating enzyme family protein [Anaerolineae bacterium]